MMDCCKAVGDVLWVHVKGGSMYHEFHNLWVQGMMDPQLIYLELSQGVVNRSYLHNTTS